MKRGFTLLECLVCIAILALLASLLFPVFAKSIERGKISRSWSNMRQLYVANSLYVERYGSDPRLLVDLAPSALTVKKALQLDIALFRTGGRTIDGQPGVYTWLMPNLRDPYTGTADWEQHVHCSEFNPVWLADETFISESEIREPFNLKVAYGMDLTGSLTTRKGTGLPASYNFWCQKKEKP